MLWSLSNLVPRPSLSFPSLACSTLNCTANDRKLGGGPGNEASLEANVFAKKLNIVLDLATWSNTLECKHNVCEASVHIAQTSVSTAV